GVAFQSSSLMPSGGEMFAMLGSLPITNPQPPQPLAPPLCGYVVGSVDLKRRSSAKRTLLPVFPAVLAKAARLFSGRFDPDLHERNISAYAARER
ncbi:MAG: hypothetical protein AB7G75_27645, partial [Candidatus Binatia bacterium]